MLEVMRSLYEHAYEGLDRDVGLEIAEESNKSQTRVPGIGWFYGELSWSGSWSWSGAADDEDKEKGEWVHVNNKLDRLVKNKKMKNVEEIFFMFSLSVNEYEIVDELITHCTCKAVPVLHCFRFFIVGVF